MSAATAFAALHVPGRPFLLVNAWDVYSAVALADAGHPAIGTTSLGITAAAGILDGHGAGRLLTIDLSRTLAKILPVPVTADLEDGYDTVPGRVADLVASLAAAGVAGVNLEDGRRSAADHGEVIAAAKAAAPTVFVNARTDVFWSGSRRVADALERCRRYRDAGADGLFFPGTADDAVIEAVVALGLPVNVLWHPGRSFAALGVARTSTGSLLYRRAMAAALAAAAGAAVGQAVDGPVEDYRTTQHLLARSGPAADRGASANN